MFKKYSDNHTLHPHQQQAEQLGREDQQRLHRNKKLVLMVDLDQTLIHTTEQHCQRMSNKVLFPHITPLHCNHCAGESAIASSIT